MKNISAFSVGLASYRNLDATWSFGELQGCHESTKDVVDTFMESHGGSGEKEFSRFSVCAKTNDCGFL